MSLCFNVDTGMRQWLSFLSEGGRLAFRVLASGEVFPKVPSYFALRLHTVQQMSFYAY